MKAKAIILSAAMMFAAFAITGCQKEMDKNPGVGTETKTLHVKFGAETPEAEPATKVGIQEDGEGYKSVWHEGDAIGVYVITENDAMNTQNAKFTATVDGSGAATFSGSITVPESGSIACNVYYYYPYCETAGAHTDVKVTLPREQAPGIDGIDPKANIMMGSEAIESNLTPNGIDGDITLKFKHKATFMHFNIESCTAAGVNVGTEKVKYFKVEHSAASLGGLTRNFNLTSHASINLGFEAIGKSVYIIIPEEKQTTLADFEGWLAVARFSCNSNMFSTDVITITIVTDSHTIVKTWTPIYVPDFNGGSKAFAEGEVSKVRISITDSDTITDVTEMPAGKYSMVTELTDDMSGAYFMAGTPDDGATWYIPNGNEYGQDKIGLIMVPATFVKTDGPCFDLFDIVTNNALTIAKTDDGFYTLRQVCGHPSYYNYYVAPKGDVDAVKTYGLDFLSALDSTTGRTNWTIARTDDRWVIANAATSTEYGGGKYLRFYDGMNARGERTYYIYGYESLATSAPYYDIHLFKKMN